MTNQQIGVERANIFEAIAYISTTSISYSINNNTPNSLSESFIEDIDHIDRQRQMEHFSCHYYLFPVSSRLDIRTGVNRV